MAKTCDFISDPFKCNLNYEYEILFISLTHISDCLVWKACIVSPLYNDYDKTPFNVNPKPNQVFDLLEAYHNDKLSNDLKIIFPTNYTNKSDRLYISLKWNLNIGNEQLCSVRDIALLPEFISQDVLLSRKLEYINEKLDNRINNLEIVTNKITTNKMLSTEDKYKLKLEIKNEVYDELVTFIMDVKNDIMTSMKSEIMNIKNEIMSIKKEQNDDDNEDDNIDFITADFEL